MTVPTGNTAAGQALSRNEECCVIRTRIPLAPRGPDVTVYIVLNDYGSLGRAYVETDAAKADEATVIENILTGEYSCPLSVVAFNTVEGWARDVTEDIAREVMRRGENEIILERVLRADVQVLD